MRVVMIFSLAVGAVREIAIGKYSGNLPLFITYADLTSLRIAEWQLLHESETVSISSGLNASCDARQLDKTKTCSPCIVNIAR